MSDKSSTQVSIPDALTASVHQHTQYGMQYPDGTVSWGVVNVEGVSLVVQDIVLHDGGSRMRWVNWLAKQAEKARINAYDYGNQHKVITRTVMLAVTEAADHTDLRPWGVLGPVEPLVVKAPAARRPPWD